ncbi:hypothetical protein ABZW49_29120 [Nonomuraea wenchangensis]
MIEDGILLIFTVPNGVVIGSIQYTVSSLTTLDYGSLRWSQSWHYQANTVAGPAIPAVLDSFVYAEPECLASCTVSSSGLVGGSALPGRTHSLVRQRGVGQPDDDPLDHGAGGASLRRRAARVSDGLRLRLRPSGARRAVVALSVVRPPPPARHQPFQDAERPDQDPEPDPDGQQLQHDLPAGAPQAHGSGDLVV